MRVLAVLPIAQFVRRLIAFTLTFAYTRIHGNRVISLEIPVYATQVPNCSCSCWIGATWNIRHGDNRALPDRVRHAFCSAIVSSRCNYGIISFLIPPFFLHLSSGDRVHLSFALDWNTRGATSRGWAFTRASKFFGCIDGLSKYRSQQFVKTSTACMCTCTFPFFSSLDLNTSRSRCIPAYCLTFLISNLKV